MATLSVRQVDPVTWEPQYGNGQANFIYDLDAAVQIINTSMRLFLGEWFLNTADGLPLFQRILGASGSPRSIEVITNIISQRINSLTLFVTGVISLNVTYLNRQFSYSGTVETIFGTVSINNAPAVSAALSTS